MIKKIIVCMLSIVFILSFSSAITATDNAQPLMDEHALLQSAAIEAFNYFCSDILYQEANTKEMLTPDTFLRPEWYGGAYMDSDYTLCIKVLEGYEDVQARIVELMKPYVFRFVITDISYNELALTQYRIMKDYCGWISILLSQTDSKVIVRFDPNSENSQAMIVDISNKYHCAVFEASCWPTTFASIIGGNPLSTSSSSVFGTIGFSCKYKVPGSSVFQDGILTAGHVAHDAIDPVSGSGTLYLGHDTTYPISFSTTDSIIQFNNNGYGDYAFIPANGHTLTNRVRNSSNSTTAITNAYCASYSENLTGTYVNKYGDVTGITTGQLTGSCLVTYQLSQYDYITILGVWEVYDNFYTLTNPISSNGDSGAPVWQNVSGENTLMGILSGGSNIYLETYSQGKYFYFTPFQIMSMNYVEYGNDFTLQLSQTP